MKGAHNTSQSSRPSPTILTVLAFLLSASVILTALVVTAAQGPPDLLSQADSIFQQMSELTGLPIKSSLKKQVISRPEVSKYIADTLHSEMTPQEMHIQEATLQAFGLVPPDFNLEKFLVSFYTEQAAGFYDPIRKTMFIADWVEPDMQRMVLAHELTHALQDQSYDLEKFLKAARDDDDASAAREAVVEGHATAAMIQEMMAPMKLEVMPSLVPVMAPIIQQQLEEYPAFTKAPFFFRFQALFPYIEGIGFMQHGLQAGGWKRLNSLFEDPPTATKEIFQPEVYFDKQPLPKVSLPQPAELAGVHGLSFLAENIMGEMGYYALLGQLISEDEAKSVTPNWLADRYLLYEKSDAGPGKKQYVLVSQTRWSSPESAQAFFRDYHTILSHKYSELASDSRSTNDVFIGKTNNGEVVMLRKDADCLWAEGIPASQAEAVLNWLKSR